MKEKMFSTGDRFSRVIPFHLCSHNNFLVLCLER